MRSVVACVGLVVLACAGTSASAADVPRYQPVPSAPYYSPLYNWTGFYLGINGGLIGGTIGYNWQVRELVVGAEGDIDWSGIKGTTTVFCPGGCETRNQWLATVRGRLGYAWDRFLPYLTAGLAAGDINATRPGLPAGTSTNAGWTVGAGLEVGVVSNVSVKAEYLYVDLGTFNCGLNCGLAPTGNVSFDANIFRGGLNVRF
jgi:outer membrane immunogenic protein